MDRSSTECVQQSSLAEMLKRTLGLSAPELVGRYFDDVANHDGKRLDDKRYKLIVQTCDEILAGQHQDMFPLHVWMTGSGTQFNMNVNEVISNRCSQIAGTPLGSK